MNPTDGKMPIMVRREFVGGPLDGDTKVLQESCAQVVIERASDGIRRGIYEVAPSRDGGPHVMKWVPAT